MEVPPKFLEGLAKYYKNDLDGAKEFLDGDDLYSKALLVLVDVKMDDGSKNKEIQERIDAMDFKGNDIALMFCVLAQEYGLQMTKAHNLLLKRFGKEEKPIASQKEVDENEANTKVNEDKGSEEMPELEPAEVKPEAEAAAPEAKPAVEAAKPKPEPVPEAKPEQKPEPVPEAKQVGGKRVTRKASSLGKKKKRVSRGKA
jgi:hypothetical protein